MKVYVVTKDIETSYELDNESVLLKVFSTFEKAQKYIEELLSKEKILFEVVNKYCYRYIDSDEYEIYYLIEEMEVL